jgi:hypothetical protein
MFLIEVALLVIAVIVALLRPQTGSRYFERLERNFARLAHRRGIAVITVFVAALAIRAALLPVFPVPEPVVHDEFGYLLAADTFAHGRSTNPPHSMWVHFETFSVIQQPTYQCYGPPAQGLFLAMGTLLGHPFLGVMLSAALMSVSICWMLQAWLPPRWALLGGLLAILRFGTLTYWGQSYWGGSVAAVGGALVLGALPRIKRSMRVRDSVIMAVGLAILANSRPYEGFIFAIPVCTAMLAWMVSKRRPTVRVLFSRTVTPLCLILLSAALITGYYFRRVTGSAFRMPYQIEQQTYAVAPYMLWQSPRPQPVYRHQIIRKMYLDALPKAYLLSRTAAGPLSKIILLWSFYIGPAFSLPLVMMIFVLPYGFFWSSMKRQTRFLILALGTSVAGWMVEVFFTPHYAAPATALILTLVLLAMRRLQGWNWHGKPSGLFLVRILPMICLIMFVLRCSASPLRIPLSESYTPAWYQAGPKPFGRSTIEKILHHLPGQQLVIVRYDSSHEPFQEWVYNDADIDAAQTVWAHDMSPAENRGLITYFGGRNPWLLEADQKPPSLSAYSDALTPSSQESTERDSKETNGEATHVKD